MTNQPGGLTRGLPCAAAAYPVTPQYKVCPIMEYDFFPAQAYRSTGSVKGSTPGGQRIHHKIGAGRPWIANKPVRWSGWTEQRAIRYTDRLKIARMLRQIG